MSVGTLNIRSQEFPVGQQSTSCENLSNGEASSQNTLAGLTLADRNNILLTWVYCIEGADPHSLLDHGKGIIELTLKRTGKQLSLSGKFIESSTGEPLETVRIKQGFTFWNPKPLPF